MNPVETLRADWDALHAKLRQPQNNFHPACDACTDGICCQEPVFSDQAEADDILNRLTPEQLATLSQDVLNWYQNITLAGMLALPEKGIAFPYRNACLPCPFLKAGRCSIYEYRPLACRTHYALENPQNCNMPARKTQKYAHWEQSEPYLTIVVKYAMTVGVLKIDHFALMIYNRLFDRQERSKAASQFEIEKVEA